MKKLSKKFFLHLDFPLVMRNFQKMHWKAVQCFFVKCLHRSFGWSGGEENCLTIVLYSRKYWNSAKRVKTSPFSNSKLTSKNDEHLVAIENYRKKFFLHSDFPLVLRNFQKLHWKAVQWFFCEMFVQVFWMIRREEIFFTIVLYSTEYWNSAKRVKTASFSNSKLISKMIDIINHWKKSA